MKGISTTFIQYIVVFDLLNESKLSPWALVLTYDHFTQKTPPKERVKEFGSQGAVLFDPVYNKDVKNRMREERSKDLKDFLRGNKRHCLRLAGWWREPPLHPIIPHAYVIKVCFSVCVSLCIVTCIQIFSFIYVNMYYVGIMHIVYYQDSYNKGIVWLE